MLLCPLDHLGEDFCADIRNGNDFVRIDVVQSGSRIWTSLTWLNFFVWFGFRLEPIFDTVPAASNMTLASKVVKK